MVKVDWSLLEAAYANNPNIRSLAREFGLNYQSLSKRFRRKGLKGKGVLVKVDKQKARELYQEGYSVHAIGKYFGVNGKLIYSKLAKEGVELRKPGNVLELIHNYFEILDTPNKQYWFGVLCGDGCVVDGKVQIGVSANDGVWMNTFLKEVGSNTSASFVSNDWSGAVHVSLVSEKMYGDLKSHGLVDRKSKVLDCSLDSNHFWRGVLDSDGCIFLGEKNCNYVNAVTSGSEKFIARTTKLLKELNLDFKIYDADGVKTVRLFGSKGKTYLDWLYEGSEYTSRLERKFNKYLEYTGRSAEVRNGFFPIEFNVAESFIKINHYLKTCKPSKTYGWYDGGDLIAVAAVSSCSSPSVAASIYKDNVSRVRELHRFCIARGKNVPNLASKFLAEVLRSYSLDYPNIWAVVAYADESQGHEGTIYKAVSAVLLESPSKPELVVVLPNGLKFTGRDEVVLSQVKSAGFKISDCKLEESEGKYKYVMFLGSGKQKSDRNKMMNK